MNTQYANIKKVIIIIPMIILIALNYAHAQSPGGVSGELRLWLRPEIGTSTFTDGVNLNQWNDQSSFGNNATQAIASNRPTYRLNNLNFNPGVEFGPTTADSDWLLLPEILPADRVSTYYDQLNFTSQSHSITVVYRPDYAANIFSPIITLGDGNNSNHGSAALDPCERETFLLTTGANSIHRTREGTLQNSVTYPNSPSGVRISALSLDVSSTPIFDFNLMADNGEYDYIFTIAAASHLNECDAGRRGAIGSVLDFGSPGTYLTSTTPPPADFYLGNIYEIIVFNKKHITTAENKRLQSYLAIKYGVTLSKDDNKNGTLFETPDSRGNHEGDYMYSNGTTVLWDASVNSDYHKDIFGIGRDITSTLDQKVSRSSNPTGVALFSTIDDMVSPNEDPSRTSLVNGTFMVAGDDDGSATWEATDAPPKFNILNKKWILEETGVINDVFVGFDVEDPDFNIPPPIFGTIYYLIFDTDLDGLLADEVPIAMNLETGTNIHKTIADMADGAKFTIATSTEIILPIELLYFNLNVIQDNVELTWATASEENNSHFVIQRSLDGRAWNSINQQQGAGNSSTELQYMYTDTGLSFGTYYYRLVQVDFDGTESYSNVRIANFVDSNFELYPNPAANQVVFAAKESIADVRIYNLQGKLTLNQAIEGYSQSASVNIDHLSAGNYIMVLITEKGNRITKKLVVVK